MEGIENARNERNFRGPQKFTLSGNIELHSPQNEHITKKYKKIVSILQRFIRLGNVFMYVCIYVCM